MHLNPNYWRLSCVAGKRLNRYLPGQAACAAVMRQNRRRICFWIVSEARRPLNPILSSAAVAVNYRQNRVFVFGAAESRRNRVLCAAVSYQNHAVVAAVNCLNHAAAADVAANCHRNRAAAVF